MNFDEWWNSIGGGNKTPDYYLAKSAYLHGKRELLKEKPKKRHCSYCDIEFVAENRNIGDCGFYCDDCISL